MSRRVKLTIGSSARALDRFEALWNRVAEGEPPPEAQVLSFADLPLLLKTLTPLRWVLLERLREAGPVTVYALAKLLARDYKNVHTDVKALAEIDLVARREDGRVEVRWEKIVAEFPAGR